MASTAALAANYSAPRSANPSFIERKYVVAVAPCKQKPPILSPFP